MARTRPGAGKSRCTARRRRCTSLCDPRRSARRKKKRASYHRSLVDFLSLGPCNFAFFFFFFAPARRIENGIRKDQHCLAEGKTMYSSNLNFAETVKSNYLNLKIKSEGDEREQRASRVERTGYRRASSTRSRAHPTRTRIATCTL